MAKITAKPLLKKKSILLTFLILCSLFLSENAFSREHWNRDYVKVDYNANDVAILITFQFYDFYFGPWWDHAWLEWCDFEFSVDGKNYQRLMSCNTYFQSVDYWAELYLKNKLSTADLELYEVCKPTHWVSCMWDNDFIVRGVPEPVVKGKAKTRVKWFLRETYKDVRFIRITGKWNVKGILLCPDNINNEIYKVPVPETQAIKSVIETDTKYEYGNVHGVDKPEKDAVKVTKEEDAIIIQGAISGEMINVYSTTGAMIKSTVVNNDVVKVKLPANQVYIVHVGQARYKMAL